MNLIFRIALILMLMHSSAWTSILCGQDYVHLTVRDGLPSNMVYGAIEDTDGYIWFFTDNGVAKYDGYKFDIFNRDDGIIDSDIWHIHEDMYHRKWLISSTNFGFYIKNDSVKRVDFVQFDFIQPHHIHYIDEGLIYYYDDSLMISAHDELFKLNIDNYHEGTENLDGLKALKLSKGSEKKIIEFLNSNKPNLNIDQFLSNNCFNNKDDYYCWDGSDLNFAIKNGFELIIKKNDDEVTIELAPYGIEKIKAIQKRNENLFIHHTKGYLEIDLLAEQIENAILIPFIDHDFTRILFDDQYLIAGSYYDGAVITSSRVSDKKFLPNEEIHTISYDGENRFQLITEDEEIYDYNSGNNEISLLQYKNKHLQKEKVVKANKKSYLLFEKNIIDLVNEEKLYYGDGDSLLYSNDRGALLDLSNSKDIVVTDSVLFILRYNYFLAISTQSKMHPIIDRVEADVTCIEDYDNQLIIGTNKGLFTLDEYQMTRLSNIDSMPSVNVTGLLNFEDEKLVLVSDFIKLHFWDNSTWTSIPDFNSPITELSSGGKYLYGLTADHLFRVNIEDDFEVQRFYFHAISGLGKIIALESSADTVFLGTENGYYKLHHDDLKIISDLPKFTSLDVYHNGIQITEEELGHISSSQNNLEFNFKALSIISLGNIEYSYRLLPSENAWNRTKDLDVTYTSLSANDYSFEVFATDAFGNKSKVERLSLTIRPSLFESIPFYIFASLFLIGLISVFYRFRLRRMQRDEMQKTLMNQRIAQYELQALRAQMNPHFIFNVLSSIQNAIRNQDVETADNYLYNFASLIRKFLDFSEKRYLVLKEEIDLIKLYTDIENLRFNPRMDIRFEIDEELDIENTFIPSMLLQPLVENAINHGLFYKKSDRKLTLSFKNIEQGLKIIILDNGVGRDQSNKNKKRRATNHTSKASLNIRSRIEILNQSKEVKIEYSIDDLKDQNNEAKGTRVNLLIINHDAISHNNR